MSVCITQCAEPKYKNWKNIGTVHFKFHNNERKYHYESRKVIFSFKLP